jgi:hypothetical protein
MIHRAHSANRTETVFPTTPRRPDFYLDALIGARGGPFPSLGDVVTVTGLPGSISGTATPAAVDTSHLTP